jgi:hypothetical protein
MIGSRQCAGLRFVGLICVYVSEFLASMFMVPRSRTGARPTHLNLFGERAMGFSRLVTGAWLMDLTVAATLNAASGYSLPL